MLGMFLVFFLVLSIFILIISTISLKYKNSYKVINHTYVIKIESKTPDGSGVSNIIIGDTEFLTPHITYKMAGTYDIKAKEWGREYLFDHWTFSGGINVDDIFNIVTKMTVIGDGILKAVYVPIEIQVNVSPHHGILCVGENCSIEVSVNSDTNQTHVYVRPILIAPNGSKVSTFPYTPVLISRDTTTFYWPEKGVRGWDAVGAATRPGPYSIFIHVSAGDDINKPNFGSIIVKEFLLEFMVDIGKSYLELIGADASWERGNYTKKVDIIWDYVEVYNGGSSLNKLKLGNSTIVWFKARYGYYSTYFENSAGTLYVNDSACIWSPTRYRWEHNVSSDKPGILTFKVSNIINIQNEANMWYDNIGVIEVEWVMNERTPKHEHN